MNISGCGCNILGSTSKQCASSGQCNCRTNIMGLKCDQCKPHLTGEFPHCVCKVIMNYSLLCGL